MKDDWSLLREFAETHSQGAFATLLHRHADMVYAACLRRLHNTHDAEDAAQAVFIILARKAGSIPRGTIVAVWLYRTAGFVAAELLRANRRKRRHETAAAAAAQAVRERRENAMAPEPSGEELDLALTRLAKREWAAILLRFFEGRSYDEVAAELGVSSDAAKKQVQRAVRRLREAMGGTGGAPLCDAAVLALLAAARRPAPAHLQTLILHAVLTSGDAAGTGAALAKGALFMMMLTRIKLIICCVMLATAAGAIALWAAQNAEQPVEQPKDVVVDFSGKPVPNASVEVATDEQPVFVYATPGANSVKTDEEGRFSVRAAAGDAWLCVRSDRGFAKIKQQDLARTHRIVLDAWGSIEGTVKIGKDTAPGQKMSVIGLPNFDPKFLPNGVVVSPFLYELTTMSDGQGHFSFPRVVPGEWIVGRVPTAIGAQLMARYPQVVTVAPGKQTTLTLGGTGRAVVGRLVSADNKVKFDTNDLCAGEIYRVPPPMNLPPGLTRANYQAEQKKWVLSPAGKDFRLAHAYVYWFPIAADGAFRVDDLPAGKYGFVAKGSQSQVSFVIPDMPLGYSDTPLDLGDVAFVPLPK